MLLFQPCVSRTAKHEHYSLKSVSVGFFILVVLARSSRFLHNYESHLPTTTVQKFLLYRARTPAPCRKRKGEHDRHETSIHTEDDAQLEPGK